MHMQARMQAWDGGEGKIKNLRKGIAEVSLSKAATVPFQRIHWESLEGIHWIQFAREKSWCLSSVLIDTITYHND